MNELLILFIACIGFITIGGIAIISYGLYDYLERRKYRSLQRNITQTLNRIDSDKIKVDEVK